MKICIWGETTQTLLLLGQRWKKKKCSQKWQQVALKNVLFIFFLNYDSLSSLNSNITLLLQCPQSSGAGINSSCSLEVNDRMCQKFLSCACTIINVPLSLLWWQSDLSPFVLMTTVMTREDRVFDTIIRLHLGIACKTKKCNMIWAQMQYVTNEIMNSRDTEMQGSREKGQTIVISMDHLANPKKRYIYIEKEL